MIFIKNSFSRVFVLAYNHQLSCWHLLLPLIFSFFSHLIFWPLLGFFWQHFFFIWASFLPFRISQKGEQRGCMFNALKMISSKCCGSFHSMIDKHNLTVVEVEYLVSFLKYLVLKLLKYSLF